MSTPATNQDAFTDPAQDVLFRVVNRVALITLNRPSALNALSYEMVRALAALFERCRNDDRIVAVVLRGAGGRVSARAATCGNCTAWSRSVKRGCRSSSTNTGSTMRSIRFRSRSSR